MMGTAETERLRRQFDDLIRDARRRLPQDDGEPDCILGIPYHYLTGWSNELDPLDNATLDFRRQPRWYYVQAVRILNATPPTLAALESTSGAILAANIGRCLVPYNTSTPVDDYKSHIIVRCTRYTNAWAFRWEGV